MVPVSACSDTDRDRVGDRSSEKVGMERDRVSVWSSVTVGESVCVTALLIV